MDTTKTVMVTGMATGMSAAIIAGNPSIFLRIMDVLQDVFYILYIDVNYPPRVTWFFTLFQTFDLKFIPNLISQSLLDDEVMLSPRIFMENQMDANFIANTNEFFFGFVAIIGSFIFFLILDAIFKYYRFRK
jgi:hypothetical protein